MGASEILSSVEWWNKFSGELPTQRYIQGDTAAKRNVVKLI
jgi:hypothetical protein